MRALRTLVCLLPFLAPALASCVSHTAERPKGFELAAPTRSRAIEAWEVVDGGRVVGTVVVFEVQGRTERFFLVRNPHQQELGMVDAEGRWWRYAPHAAEPDWLGSGTVRDGVCRILGAPADAPFYEVPLSTLVREASAPGASQN